jgi:Domain of unknown function (DUF3854)/D5 N terminal like
MNSEQSTLDRLLADLQPEHLAEFKASAIADDISVRNLRSFEPSTNPNDTGSEYELDEIFGILIDNPEHVNNGTLSGTTLRLLFNILCHGGWVYEGHKGKIVKPNEPRKGKQKKIIDDDLKLDIEQKLIKYESVRGKGNQQIFIPHVTVRASLLIAKNLEIANYVPSSEDPSAIDTNFWDCMAKGDYPIFITEGVKKTLSIISNGFPAIGLNGVCGWSNGKDENGKRLIHQELRPFLNGREIVLAFDIDKSPKTVKNVNAEKLAFRNCVKGKVSQIKWEGFKGIDDFLASFPESEREREGELYRLFIHARSEVEALKQNSEQAKKDAGTAQGQSNPSKPNPAALCISKKVFRDLFEDSIRFDASVKQYWRYDGEGKWVICSDEYIFGIVQKYLEKHAPSEFTPSYVRNVIEFARVDFLHDGWTEASNLLYIPFENGVLELATRQLLNHLPDYGFTWQLP